MDPRFKYDLIFIKFDIQSRQNPPFGSDDLVPNFGPTIKVLSKFNKFGTKDNGIFELIFIAWTLGNFILKLKYAPLLFIGLGI